MSADLMLVVGPREDRADRWLEINALRDKISFTCSGYNPDSEYIDAEGIIRQIHPCPECDDVLGMLFEDSTRLDQEAYSLTAAAVFIGEVSWMKAGLFEEDNLWVSPMVDAVQGLFSSDRYQVITPKFITRVMVAMNNSDDCWYTRRHWRQDNEGRAITRKGHHIPQRKNQYPTTGAATRSDVKKALIPYMGHVVSVETW